MSAAQAKAPKTIQIIHPEDGKPWWKFAHVWLVISGLGGGDCGCGDGLYCNEQA